MDTHEINSSELDKIGSKLISSSALNESEIERIAGSPFLYTGVRARIDTAAPQTRGAFGLGRLALGFGSLLVVVGIAVAGLFLLRDGVPTLAERQVHTPIPQRESPVTYSSSKIGDTESSASAVVIPSRRDSPQIQKASYTKTDDRRPVRQNPVPERQPDLEFYPLTFAGDLVETTSGGRVLQVELSRSSLFAMGFNIPIENGAEVVKADLLVGPDGVARAIRLH